MHDPLSITDRDRLMELLAGVQRGADRSINEVELANALRARVRGQDQVIQDLARTIRIQWGKRRRSKPIANLMFVGPTGTGKTELAKALAEHLFGDERAMVRFDCGEFSGPEGKTRLIGTPVGYQGSSQGGQLTRPVINNPKRIVLFDEIEKGWSGIFDLFLSIMGEGRLTEQGSGKVADFTQSIVILTSNSESEAIGRIQQEISDPHEMLDSVKKHLRDTKVFRAEIAGRIDRIYVFRPLDGIVNAEITALKMKRLADEYGLDLQYVDPQLIVDAMEQGNKLKEFGARELERAVSDLLGEGMLAAKDAGAKAIQIRLDPAGTLCIDPT